MINQLKLFYSHFFFDLKLISLTWFLLGKVAKFFQKCKAKLPRGQDSDSLPNIKPFANFKKPFDC